MANIVSARKKRQLARRKQSIARVVNHHSASCALPLQKGDIVLLDRFLVMLKVGAGEEGISLLADNPQQQPTDSIAPWVNLEEAFLAQNFLCKAGQKAETAKVSAQMVPTESLWIRRR